MLNDIQLDKILFLDIETVAEFEEMDKLSESKQELWTNKAIQRYPNEEKSASELIVFITSAICIILFGIIYLLCCPSF